MKVVGVISGTSADAVDAALLEVLLPGDDPGGTGSSARDPRASLVAYRELPFPQATRDRILGASSSTVGTRELAALRRELGEWFGTAVRELLGHAGVDPHEVAAVGSHGQTVWHEPPAASGAEAGTSLQLGDPSVVAAMSGIPVVSDFRSADLAAGGEGAPLVPWPDQILFAREGQALAIQNLGGIGNVTWLPPRGDPRDPVAFDTGPGNSLLDVAASMATGGRAGFDRDGALARSGRPDEGLLARLMEHRFFRLPPPRSTGREVFGAALVESLARERGLEPGRPEGWGDLVATLAAFTVESVRVAYREWIVPLGADRVVLTGGGARNPVLAEGLRSALAPLPVETGAAALGMDPDAREAAAFALLAWAFLHGRPGNVPACTGASGPRVLGSWTPAPGRREWWIQR
ncbi:MAG: anhydro-N-acetylmuramic acid kinase [Gemmatimonadales bacterium]|jgi:anhydro-N-acetylmuramic acid kinase|nr:MAG: anhydro-N-acetylmuramic acid kinase [Gemmatimonadales bacterium]